MSRNTGIFKAVEAEKGRVSLWYYLPKRSTQRLSHQRDSGGETGRQKRGTAFSIDKFWDKLGVGRRWRICWGF